MFVIISYAAGYAIGTYLGGIINKYFVKGTLTAMVITTKDKKLLTDTLKDANYGVTVIPLEENTALMLGEI